MRITAVTLALLLVVAAYPVATSSHQLIFTARLCQQDNGDELATEPAPEPFNNQDVGNELT